VSSALQPGKATRASRWLIAAFVVGALFAMNWAALWTLAVINSDYSSHFVENFVLNAVVWLASLAVLLLQSAALAGLYTRSHWGRTVATIASGFWVFTIVGIPFTALVWWALHKRWDTGVDSTFTRDHPSAPAYLLGLTGVGTALVLVWLWFLYLYLVPMLQQLNPSAPVAGWLWIVTLALFFSLPTWVVQGLALVGLLQKHDWGAVLAVITCVLWIMSIVGLPFGIAGLFVIWSWQHPALRPQVSGAPA
jgi:hypothetical protein